jgi:hypothetical protein
LVAQAALYAPESSATLTVALPRVKLGGSFTAAHAQQREAGAARHKVQHPDDSMTYSNTLKGAAIPTACI